MRDLMDLLKKEQRLLERLEELDWKINDCERGSECDFDEQRLKQDKLLKTRKNIYISLKKELVKYEKYVK